MYIQAMDLDRPAYVLINKGLSGTIRNGRIW